MSSTHTMFERSGLAGVGAVVVAAGVAIGTALGLYTGWRSGLSAGESLLLAGYLSGLYTIVSAAIAIPPSLALWPLGYPPTPRRAVALLAAAYVVVNGSTRYISTVQFISVTPHMTAVGLLDALVVVSAALALGGLIAARRSGLGAVIAVLLIAALETFHQIHEPARELDLSGYVSTGGDAAMHDPVEAPSDGRLQNARVAILGLDGLSWEVLVPMLERGELPSFRALIGGAAIGHLATLYYPRSPALWETMATGRRPTEHGIADHAHLVFPGIERSIGHFPHFPLANSVMGVNRLLIGTAPLAPWSKRPSGALDARAARFWEIASARGISVGIYHWLNTIPVSPVRGFLWGFGRGSPRSFPVGLDPDWEAPRKPPAGPGPEWVEGAIPAERAIFDHFLGLARKFDPELLAYYTHFGDGVNHTNWKVEAHDDAIFFPGLRTHDFEPGPIVTATLRFLDEVLGSYRRSLPPDVTLLVVSDHGFDFRGYEHDNAPAGVVIVSGPEIRPGLIEGASLYHLAPTVLHLLGLPVAEDMEAGPLEIAAPGSSLERAPEHVASHGAAPERLPPDASAPEDTSDYEAYLKALGYVN